MTEKSLGHIVYTSLVHKMLLQVNENVPPHAAAYVTRVAVEYWFKKIGSAAKKRTTVDGTSSDDSEESDDDEEEEGRLIKKEEPFDD